MGVILVARECILNALIVLLGLPTFDDTDFLGHPQCRAISRLSVSTLVTASRFIMGNRKAELKPITFSSSLLFFLVLPSFLFSCHPPPPSD